MDAKRWSPLWVFAGGCLTGAALIGSHATGGGAEGASNARDAERTGQPALSRARSLEEPMLADPAAGSVAQSAATSSKPEIANLVAAPRADTGSRDKTEAGNSVADVLARLESEYRQRDVDGDKPAGSPQNQQAAANARDVEPNVVSELKAPKLAKNEEPAILRAATPPPATPPSNGTVANSSAEPEPAPSTPDAETARVASLRDRQAQALENGQQQLTAQMQELAALQQATLVQQAALVQYLQLLSLPSASRVTRATRAERPPSGGRIVAARASSISDSDNPWGFDFTPTILVR